MQPDQQQRIMGYFIEEAKDHLNTIEQGLLNLQSTIEDSEMANEVFRAAHSVKGGAAMLGLGSIQRVSHRLEDFFKLLKDTPVKVDQKLESLFLKAFDALQELLTQLQGPFGLPEEAANAIVAGVEPTFEELEQHLNQLATASGGIRPELIGVGSDSSFAFSPPIETSLEQLFRTDVPARLRDMLQLFKQPQSDANTQQQLQEICRSLSSLGEQYGLSNWCHVVETARRAIANPDNSYRLLAPIVIKDIKHAQDFVLSGRSAEIYPCDELQALVPITAAAPLVQDDDFADLMAGLDNINSASDEPITEAIELSFGESEFSFEGLELEAQSGELDFGDLSAEELDDELSVRNGPEVGMAELNTLADLFEGEVPDLGLTWQEEVVIDDPSDLFSTSATDQSPLDLSSDFSDLLFDETPIPSSVSGSADADLNDLFGDSLLEDDSVEPAIAEPTSSSEPSELSELSDFDDLLSITASEPTYDTGALDLEALTDDPQPVTPLEADTALDDLGGLFGELDNAEIPTLPLADEFLPSVDPVIPELSDESTFDAALPQIDGLTFATEDLSDPIEAFASSDDLDFGDLFEPATDSEDPFTDNVDFGGLESSFDTLLDADQSEVALDSLLDSALPTIDESSDEQSDEPMGNDLGEVLDSTAFHSSEPLPDPWVEPFTDESLNSVSSNEFSLDFLELDDSTGEQPDPIPSELPAVLDEFDLDTSTAGILDLETELGQEDDLFTSSDDGYGLDSHSHALDDLFGDPDSPSDEVAEAENLLTESDTSLDLDNLLDFNTVINSDDLFGSDEELFGSESLPSPEGLPDSENLFGADEALDEEALFGSESLLDADNALFGADDALDEDALFGAENSATGSAFFDPDPSPDARILPQFDLFGEDEPADRRLGLEDDTEKAAIADSNSVDLFNDSTSESNASEAALPESAESDDLDLSMFDLESDSSDSGDLFDKVSSASEAALPESAESDDLDLSMFDLESDSSDSGDLFDEASSASEAGLPESAESDDLDLSMFDLESDSSDSEDLLDGDSLFSFQDSSLESVLSDELQPPTTAIQDDSDELDSWLVDSLVDLDGDSSLEVAPPPDIESHGDSQDFDELDSLLDEDFLLSANEAPSIPETEELTAFEGLVSQPDSSPSEFADLEDLLGESFPGEEGVATDGIAAFVDQAASTADLNSSTTTEDFSDLEALLGEEEVAESVSGFASGETNDTEFGDLDDLLKETEERMGGSPSVAIGRGLAPQARRTNRPGRVFSEQTMRVPVKHLDNLSNLVGELVVNRNSLEQDQERLRQSLDNLLYQVQQLSDVGQRMQDLYERSLLESSLLASRQGYRAGSFGTHREPVGTDVTSSSGIEYDPLEMDRFTGFHSLSQEMIELIVRVRESSSDIGFIVDETEQVTRMFRQVTTQLQEGLTRSRMVPFAQTADRLPRAVRDISMKVGKQAELIIEGRETLIDKMILEQLYDPMTHLVNNAITHGIESPDVRFAAGKPPAGRITIRAFHQGNQTIISVSDDGAGIDIERVKAKAIEKRLITAAEAKGLSRLDMYDILFHPGFSTKDQADDYAGRGVGMDVVRTSLSEIRGVINTDSTPNKGTTFTIRLPLTLSISKALNCISDRARIAFPMDGVEDMLDMPKERVQTNAEGQPCIAWRDTILPVRPLSELVAYNRHLSRGNVYGGNQDDDTVSIVVLRSAGNFLALQVDQVLGEQEIVIKQLEGPVPKPLGVAGATVLGDGRIMPIADVLELIDLSMGRIRRDAGGSLWDQGGGQPMPEAPVVKTEPMVLIVDDSITVRELLSMTFNKVGYRVEQARDGQDAWEKLRSGLPCDIVFCDIEMPRMDGLELLSRIQKDPNLKHLPIAMLTSRGADRHRQMAASLGASGYFTKPYLEEALLDAAQRMLKGERLLSS